MPEYLLIAFADISEEHLQYQDLELQQIRDVSLRPAVQENRIKVIEHGGTTFESLSNMLNAPDSHEITMFHYSGHSSKEGLNVQWKEETRTIEKEFMVVLFRTQQKLRLVFLNSCYSKETADALLQKGVDYVIGTTGKIKDKQAALVAAKFYEFLGSKGKPIQEAFDLTTAYFSNGTYVGDEKIKEAFRSFAVNQDQESVHPWQISAKENLSEEDKYWCLMPRSNLALSRTSEGQYYLRVFCFYEEKTEEFYQLAKYHFKQRKFLFNGVRDISSGGQPTPEEMIQECKSADIILHLLTGVEYVRLLENEWNVTLNTCRPKINITVNYGNDYQTPLTHLVQAGFLFKVHFPNQTILVNSVEGYLTLGHSLQKVFSLALATELASFFQQYSITPESLEGALEEFEYLSEFYNYNKYCDRSKRILFFLLEGTAQCAQILLYKRFLREAKLEKNIQPVRLPFVSTNGTISTPEQFYLALGKELLQRTTIPDSYSSAQRCIEDIENKLYVQPVVILIEGIDDTGDGTAISEEVFNLRKTMLASFWENLNRHLSPNIAYRLLVFVINKSYPEVKLETLNTCQRQDCWPDNIRIEKLLSAEYDRWLELLQIRFEAEALQKLKADQSGIIDNYREVSLREICNRLIPGEPIVEKLLKP